MNQKWLLRVVAGSTLASTLLVAPLSALAAVPDRVEFNQTMTRTTEGGRTGYRVDITDRVFRWVPHTSERVSAIGSGSGLSAADLDAITAWFKSQGIDPTDDQIRAKIAEVKQQKSIDGILANWQNTTGTSRISTYSQAGATALALAEALMKTGQFGAPNVNVGNHDEFMNYAYNVANRGWPMQAAAIHSNEYAGGNRTVSQAAFNRAWDLVMSNAAAHGWSLSDPLVLDLNGNGKIDVTGKSAAKFRSKDNQTFVANGSVMFDLKGTGKEIRTEWIGKGDGILVDNRKGKALGLVNKGKNLTIANLFGDDGGHFSGFVKLAREFDPNAKLASATGAVPADLGVLKGKALDDMLVWIDDGDGKATAKELHKLSALGITEVKLPARFVQNEAGEYLERATFTRNGKEFGVQEVWFATEENK
ncbi:MAG TPA: hypothetical protein V6D00_09975 [Pantanalinema sp.]